VPLKAGTISWYVPRSNDHFQALCARKYLSFYLEKIENNALNYNKNYPEGQRIEIGFPYLNFCSVKCKICEY